MDQDHHFDQWTSKLQQSNLLEDALVVIMYLLTLILSFSYFLFPILSNIFVLSYSHITTDNAD